MNTKYFRAALLIGLIAGMSSVMGADAPSKPKTRPTPPGRDPHTPGFVEAKELADGTVPPADVDGNFIIGPTHPRAPEMELSFIAAACRRKRPEFRWR